MQPFFVTNDTKLAAALATVGLRLKSDNPANVIYSADHPKDTGGQTFFNFDTEHPSGHFSAQELTAAYRDGKFDATFDHAVEKLSDGQRAEIQRLFILGMMTWLRSVLDNKDRLLDLIKSSRPLVQIKRANGTFTLVGAENVKENLSRFAK